MFILLFEDRFLNELQRYNTTTTTGARFNSLRRGELKQRIIIVYNAT